MRVSADVGTEESFKEGSVVALQMLRGCLLPGVEQGRGEHEGACWKWATELASGAWEMMGGGDVDNEGLGGGK